MKDHDIESKVRFDLERVGLLSMNVECNAHIVRKKFIYPIQINGYLELVQELLEPVRGFSNFVTTGRHIRWLNVSCACQALTSTRNDTSVSLSSDVTFSYNNRSYCF